LNRGWKCFVINCRAAHRGCQTSKLFRSIASLFPASRIELILPPRELKTKCIGNNSPLHQNKTSVCFLLESYARSARMSPSNLLKLQLFFKHTFCFMYGRSAKGRVRSFGSFRWGKMFLTILQNFIKHPWLWNTSKLSSINK
jgi:hypothetical protein